MPFSMFLASTTGRVHPAPRKWATFVTKAEPCLLLSQVQNTFLLDSFLLLSGCCSPFFKRDAAFDITVYVIFLLVEQGFCSNPWIPYNGHCFHLQRAVQTWPDAQRECRKEGGDLVSIRNVEDHSFIISQLGYGT